MGKTIVLKKRQAEKSFKVYELEIVLLGIKPRIWRRFVVSGNLSLAHLHDVIQAVMGWSDLHLHEFSVGEKRFGNPDPDFDMGQSIIDEREALISGVLKGPGFQFLYRYDLGDNWEHSLEVVSAITPYLGMRLPTCLAGQRACPPENCGGSPFYGDLVTSFRDSDHEQHSDSLEWLGAGFDPEQFDLAAINNRLERL
jgi:hypothetical protein